VGREELDHLVVVRRGAHRAEPQRVRPEVQLARVQRAFELGEPVAAVAVPVEDRREVREVVEVHVGVARVALVGRDAAGLRPEGALAEQLDRGEPRVVQVHARRQALDAVHDQVQVGERRARDEHVGGDAARGVVEQRGERVERDLHVGVVPPGRAPPEDELLRRPGVEPVGGQRP